MSHPLFPKVVNDSWIKDGSLKENVEKFTADVKIWNKEVFGDIFQRKKWVEARLRGIQSNIVEGPNEYLLNLESQHRKEYFEILQQEKELWSVKSRYNWLIQGDRNTRFFHTSTLIRKRRNKIVYLKNNQGNWVHDENEIVALIRNGFINLFSTRAVSALRNAWSLSTWLSFIDDEDVSMLNANLTRQEVKKGI